MSKRAGGQKGAEARPTTDRSVGKNLLARVYERCHAAILEACAYSSLPPDFLGALTANESAGDPKAARFEPSVYGHLKAIATGKASSYGGIQAADFDAEMAEVLHPKAGQFHARYLGTSFVAAHGDELAALEEEALRELATSWGYTQIMGYHMLEHHTAVRDLLEPRFHYRVAIQLLAEFAQSFQLDLERDFEQMFRCWNTGSPYGATFDPEYAAKGLRRLAIYRQIVQERLPARPSDLEADAAAPRE